MIAARLREAAARRRARWDALCLRCGRCCYEKSVRGFTVVTNWNRPCPHLDAGTRLCTVYTARFETCTACRKMTLMHALFSRWLPPECGYVRRYRRRVRAREAAYNARSFE
jgi:uncharacterized cysteine cluster protein YcgN (CxxCxxCC family)